MFAKVDVDDPVLQLKFKLNYLIKSANANINWVHKKMPKCWLKHFSILKKHLINAIKFLCD